MIEIDTSASAVERLAETLLFRGHHDQEKITHLLRRLYAERITAAKTLRALAAERDRLRAELNAAVRERDGLRHCGRQVIAERDRLREELKEARAARQAAALAGVRRAAKAEGMREAWLPVKSAPYDQDVIVRAGSMTFRAALRRDASMNEAGDSCDQWQATIEGEHPPCWSDGCCWESNQDGIPSLQPIEWRPLEAEANPFSFSPAVAATITEPTTEEQAELDRMTVGYLKNGAAE